MRPRDILARFRSCEKGVAALELALCMPLLILLVFGGWEICRFMLVQQKTEKMAFSTADVISQYQRVTVSEVSQVVAATEQIMKPFAFGANGVLILSSVSRDPTTQKQTVRWQCRSKNGLAHDSSVGEVNRDATLPGGLLLDDKDNIIISEIYYRFTPLFRTVFTKPYIIGRSALFRPRLGTLTEAPGC